MGSDFSIAGRVAFEASTGGSFLSYDDVQVRLIDAVQLQWRTEGGRWPFASDGPWHLIRKEWADWDARDAKPMPRIPLGKPELARMREAFGWLLLVPDDFDRRLILLAVTERAKGPKRVPWVRLLPMMGMAPGGGLTADNLRMRYCAAMGALTRMVNATR